MYIYMMRSNNLHVHHAIVGFEIRFMYLWYLESWAAGSDVLQFAEWLWGGC